MEVRIVWHTRTAANGARSLEKSDTILNAGRKNNIPTPPAVECGPSIRRSTNGNSTAEEMMIERIHPLKVDLRLIEYGLDPPTLNDRAIGAVAQDYS
jgi:hypothetical protein